MGSGDQLVIAISSGMAAAGTVGFAFGLVTRVLFGRVKRVEDKMADKADVTECVLKHKAIDKELSKGSDNFKALHDGQEKTKDLLIRLDERMSIFQEIFKSARVTIRGDDERG